MDLPIRFPHPADVIAQAVERDRHLTVEQRLDRLGQFYQTAWHLRIANGFGWRASAEKRESERQWREAHQESSGVMGNGSGTLPGALIDALSILAEELDRVKIPYAVIGGIAAGVRANQIYGRY